MKREIDVIENAGMLLRALKGGVLLNTMAGGKLNTMTISWGMLGIEWGKPVFITVVRDSRYSRPMLEQTKEFTVSLAIDGADKNTLSFCGTKSGRDFDKVSECGLTPVAPSVNGVPGFKEFPVTLECRVMFAQEQEEENFIDQSAMKWYPVSAGSEGGAARRDLHMAFYGEIVAAYVNE